MTAGIHSTLRSGLLSLSLFCLVVALGGAACGSGPRSANHDVTPPPRKSTLARLLEPIREQYDLPALGALIMINGKIVAADVVGTRKYGGRVRATVDDRFHLGSDTKAMTATLAAMLVDAGVVAWDTTLAELFAKLAPTMAPGYRTVTLEQLLHHVGGTPRTLAGTAAWRRLWTSHAPLRQQRYELARTILSAPRAVAPGTFAYSNAGYIIAGAALERLTDTPWEQLIQKRLFAPLHMASCGFGAPATPGKQDQPPRHQAGAARPRRRQSGCPWPRGHGSLLPARLGQVRGATSGSAARPPAAGVGQKLRANAHAGPQQPLRHGLGCRQRSHGQAGFDPRRQQHPVVRPRRGHGAHQPGAAHRHQPR